MRRFTGVLAAVFLIAPVGLRLAAAEAGSQAAACAIACGHAATPGAACCPLAREKTAGADFAVCPAGDPQSVAPNLPSQPVIAAVIHRLAAPPGHSPIAAISAVIPGRPSTRPPDHVPLFLS